MLRLAESGQYAHLVERNEEIRQRNIHVLCDHPEALIRDVSQKRTVFTRQHLEDEIIRRVGGDETLFSIVRDKVMGLENPGSHAPAQNFRGDVKGVSEALAEKLLQNKDVVRSVGRNLQDEVVFTSKALKEREDAIITVLPCA